MHVISIFLFSLCSLVLFLTEIGTIWEIQAREGILMGLFLEIKIAVNNVEIGEFEDNDFGTLRIFEIMVWKFSSWEALKPIE